MISDANSMFSLLKLVVDFCFKLHTVGVKSCYPTQCKNSTCVYLRTVHNSSLTPRGAVCTYLQTRSVLGPKLANYELNSFRIVREQSLLLLIGDGKLVVYYINYV